MHTSEPVSRMSQSGSAAVTPHLNELEKPANNQSGVEQELFESAPQVPDYSGNHQTKAIVSVEWMRYFQQHSRLLVAVIEPATLTFRYANDYFCNTTGIEVDWISDPDKIESLENALSQLLAEADRELLQRLYRRHLLHVVLRDLYQVDLHQCRLLNESVMLSLVSPLYAQSRYIEVWLRSEQLAIARLDSQLDEFADLGLPTMTQEALERLLRDPYQIRQLEQQLRIENYRIEGWLLLEGVDVTERETMRRITQLLIKQDSILKPEKFRQVDQQMQSLFNAQNTVVVCIEGKQTRLFNGAVHDELDASVYSLDSLQNSHFMQAVQTNQVIAVPDLAQDCRNDVGQKLLESGVRSLLLIPLVSYAAIEHMVEQASLSEEQDTENNRTINAHYPSKISFSQNHLASKIPNPPVVGVVGLLSDRPHHFDALDCCNAEQLIPAFTAALTDAQRQLLQRRFITNIHPAVEWRFLKEAERRSLGLAPEPIVFTEVYPLYGISDIRGSSDERNRAVQADLLQQFHLGLEIVEAACETQEMPLGQQLRLDLLDHIQTLQQGVTVDTEVSGLRYLRDNLEAHFDYFCSCGAAVRSAVNAYCAACANDHQCVYQARAAYDKTISKINTLLRETWDQWQAKMQQVSPHYCDTEATDGIDHMIYAGKSIDPGFGNFQLRSLRYEQMRAVCDCARTAMNLKERYDTNMQVTHLVLVQDLTVDIFHDEGTERLFDVRGTRDTRYEIVKKRIDKAIDEHNQSRITQPGMLTLVYSTDEEWNEYQQYLRYLMREGWVNSKIEKGTVQPLQGVNGLKYARVQVLSES